MKNFRVVYKDVDSGEFREVIVSERVVADCQRKMGTSQGVYIANAYIKGSAISKIEEIIPPERLISAPEFCSKCENGWLFGKDGAYPCNCNTKGREEVAKYKDYLDKQQWNNRKTSF